MSGWLNNFDIVLSQQKNLQICAESHNSVAEMLIVPDMTAAFQQYCI